MKVVVLFALIAYVAASQEYYPIPESALNIEAIVGDLDTLRMFMDCYMDKGPCNAISASLKRIIPEALEQSCRKCSPGLKYRVARFIQVAKLRMPREYEQLTKYYDPEYKYIDAFEDEVFKYI